ncbi:MAG: hypothetical protein K1X49_05065 [Saprospiraceae bacterium]|jgi:hypothetical protein|nr:hypothetical protein [Saprospiraceae bacterium]
MNNLEMARQGLESEHLTMTNQGKTGNGLILLYQVDHLNQVLINAKKINVIIGSEIL